MNPTQVWEWSKSVASGWLGHEKVHEVSGTMGGEDFAYFAEKVIIGLGFREPPHPWSLGYSVMSEIETLDPLHPTPDPKPRTQVPSTFSFPASPTPNPKP